MSADGTPAVFQTGGAYQQHTAAYPSSGVYMQPGQQQYIPVYYVNNANGQQQQYYVMPQQSTQIMYSQQQQVGFLTK